MDIDILYEDSNCFVINKPSGLTVHPAATTKDEKTLVEILEEERGEKVFLVHRWDKGTTGCLLIAKSQDACEKLQEQFRSRSVNKKYFAICYGVPDQKQAIIESPVGRSLINRTKMSLFKTSKSRDAITNYKVISEAGDLSLLQCKIETGRTHQIRVHLRYIGCPILGDDKYFTDASDKVSKGFDINNICLHAAELIFMPIDSKDKQIINAPIPEYFKYSAKKCGLSL